MRLAKTTPAGGACVGAAYALAGRDSPLRVSPEQVRDGRHPPVELGVVPGTAALAVSYVVEGGQDEEFLADLGEMAFWLELMASHAPSPTELLSPIVQVEGHLASCETAPPTMPSEPERWAYLKRALDELNLPPSG